jgi:proteasome lid subunit RPN8/RPN11
VSLSHLSTYSAIHEHAAQSLPNETGGFLIGRVAYDDRGACWHLEIEQAMPVEPASQNPTHFTFTWRDVDRIRSYREEHGKALLGWYHTHPDLPVFLSETDLERTHRVLFSEPFQIALVYDPVRAREGYFFWEGAQKIDASQAPWREFEIAVRDDAPADEAPTDDPAVAVPLPSATSVSRADADLDATPAQATPSPAREAAAATATPQGADEGAHASDTPHRVRLSSADDKSRDPGGPQPGGAGAAGVQTAGPFLLDEAPVLAGRADVATGTPSVPSVRTRGWTLVLVCALLALAGLLAVGYLWLVPRQG